jgi:hypothetical protein
MAAILSGSGLLCMLFVALVALVALVADVILYLNQFTKSRMWPILLVSRSTLLPAEEKND